MTEAETIFFGCGFVTLVRKKGGYLVAEDERSFKGGISPNDYFTKRGLAYAFVINGVIVKIGKSTRTMAERIKDYNAGRNNDTTEGRLMELAFGAKGKVKLFIKYAEEEYMSNGRLRKMTPGALEDNMLQDYEELYGKLPKLNFEVR